jgi:hypothetical protein
MLAGLLTLTLSSVFAERAVLKLQRSTDLSNSWQTISLGNSLLTADGKIDATSLPDDSRAFYRLVIEPISGSGSFDFEALNVLDSFFIYPASPAPFTLSSGVTPFGTNGAGFVSSTTLGIAVFKTGQRSPFDSASNYRTSIDFYFDASRVNTLGDSTIEFGYSGSATATNNPKPTLAARLIRWSQNNQKGFNYRNDNTNSSGTGSMPGYYGVTLSNGWYRIMLTAQFAGGSLNQVNFATTLISLGSNGASAPMQLLNHTNSVSNTGLLQSEWIYPYLKVSEFSGATVFDNLSYDAFP